MKVSPFHSKLPGTDRHHDESRCTVGDNIEPYNKGQRHGRAPQVPRVQADQRLASQVEGSRGVALASALFFVKPS